MNISGEPSVTHARCYTSMETNKKIHIGHICINVFSRAILPQANVEIDLRIDDRKQSVVCGILLSSLAIVCTSTYLI